MDGQQRQHIMPGIKVLIIQKHHQRRGELTEGIVAHQFCKLRHII